MRALDKCPERNGHVPVSPLSSPPPPLSPTSDDEAVRLVVRDMLSMRLANNGLGYKSRMTFMLPDCLRLKSEVSGGGPG